METTWTSRPRRVRWRPSRRPRDRNGTSRRIRRNRSWRVTRARRSRGSSSASWTCRAARGVAYSTPHSARRPWRRSSATPCGRSTIETRVRRGIRSRIRTRIRIRRLRPGRDGDSKKRRRRRRFANSSRTSSRRVPLETPSRSARTSLWWCSFPRASSPRLFPPPPPRPRTTPSRSTARRRRRFDPCSTPSSD